jgi:hypothetical protein
MSTTFLPEQNLTVWDGRLTLKLQQIASVRWFDDEIADVHLSNGKEYEIEGEDYRALQHAFRAGGSK